MVRGLGFGCTVALTASVLAGGHIVFSAPARSAEPQNAAHSIAQKFAEKPAEKPVVKSQDASKQTVSETPIVKPFAKPQTVAETVVTPPRPPLDYEMDMLRRARAERAELQKAAPAPSAPKAAASSATTHSQSVATPSSTVPMIPSATQAVTPAPVPQKLVQAPPVQPTAVPKPDTLNSSGFKPGEQAKAEAPPLVSPAVTPTAPPAGPVQQASILLTIEADGASGAAAAGQNHDPIICFAESCFVSAGLSADAIKISKSDALKLKSTTDVSTDSCNGKIACAYRNVALHKGALLQLIELGSAANDPSRTYLTEPDGTCKAADGVLTCDNPIATPDFRVWIVPEATAKTAGTPAIEEAIAEGLPHQDVARGSDK